ncbi:MAG: tetraacyldisaccharide 4'-kinase [Bacteroidota bacterium]|nr:tetraacyldisaccharide 4'-kinase [Bacteroidota bacterium]
MKIIKFLILYPISLIYGFITKVRNTLYDIKIFKSQEFYVPIISIGNITVGGTGKTPMTEYLTEILKSQYKVAILSRGYKRKTKGFILADKNSTVEQIGDEPLQMKKKNPDITVAVGENRVSAIKKIMTNDPKISLIILDDAFQHRKIKPGLSILLIDYNRPLFKDYYLPYGRLRESRNELHRAHIILITKTPDTLKPIDMRIVSKNYKLKPYQTMYFSGIEYKKPEPVFTNKSGKANIERVNNSEVLLITGIANPAPLIQYIEKENNTVTHLKFKDHHNFSNKNIDKIIDTFDNIKGENKLIITTEKDALRLQKFSDMFSGIKTQFYFVPIGVKLINPEEDEFKIQINDYIKTGSATNSFFATRRNI